MLTSLTLLWKITVFKNKSGRNIALFCVLCVLIHFSCVTLCDHRNQNPPGSSVHGFCPSKITGLSCYASPPGDLPDPGIESTSPMSPTLQADSLPAEPAGKHYFAVLQLSLMSSLIRKSLIFIFAFAFNFYVILAKVYVENRPQWFCNYHLSEVHLWFLVFGYLF